MAEPSWLCLVESHALSPKVERGLLILNGDVSVNRPANLLTIQNRLRGTHAGARSTEGCNDRRKFRTDGVASGWIVQQLNGLPGEVLGGDFSLDKFGEHAFLREQVWHGEKLHLNDAPPD